ncbi:MAG: tetratricopeptide repeat protein [Symploca sp. SIO1A3]|nr:tetratricopeptide repeat protein [Symploca sp. SIO2C1]NER49673.1 tetratricopeptide repeat protein [Symploca sp. SIO1A3]
MNAHLVLDNKATQQDIQLKKLSQYLHQHPQWCQKRLELAQLLYTRGRWQQAIEEYRRVLEWQPQLLEARLQLANILHQLGRESEAIEIYLSALPLSPNIATLRQVTGWIEACRRRHQIAVKKLESASSLEPKNATHWHALGQVHLEKESPLGALGAFDKVLAINPNDAVALRSSYYPLLAVGKFREGLQRLKQALNLAPNDFLSLKLMADHRCYQRLVYGEKGRQTKQLIQTALELAPDNADAYHSLALYYLVRGEWARGVAVMQRFARLHPDNSRSWYHYAQCLFQTGNAKAAAEAILKAYTIYHNHADIYLALCKIFPDAGRLSHLEPLLEDMLQHFPECWNVWVTAGQILVEHFQDIERGCNISAKGPQLQPQLADAWFHHGRVLALAGRHQEALVALEQGWQRLPSQGGYLSSVPAAMWLGENYQALGDNTSSRHWWKEAAQQAPELREFNPATAHYWQGKALEALGDVVGAKLAYQSALNQQLLHPTNGKVKLALVRVKFF